MTLVHDEGDGDFFFAHVCSMLERKADRIGIRVRVESSTERARVYRLSSEAKLESELDREVGVHRAQFVPGRSASDRVLTSKVQVTRGPERDRGDIIRTYNYALKRVTFHETGEVLDLDFVLAGLA